MCARGLAGTPKAEARGAGHAACSKIACAWAPGGGTAMCTAVPAYPSNLPRSVLKEIFPEIWGNLPAPMHLTTQCREM
eukprot:4310221-Prymnesium_polylepis.1